MAGVSALDDDSMPVNYTRIRVHPAREPHRYLLLRRAERTCRKLGVALRDIRELRQTTQDELAALLGMSAGAVAAMEGGDPFAEVKCWSCAWTWMGVFGNVDRVASQGTSNWQAAVAAKLAVSIADLPTLLSCSTEEVCQLLAGSSQMPIQLWLGAWREMGIERAIADAADPALEIVLASAQAAADALPELDTSRWPGA